MASTRWYTYEQNKTRGYFTGPARTVFVEAETPGQADARAEAAGLDFQSDSFSRCGRRWERMTDFVWEDGQVPTYNGAAVRIEPEPDLTAPAASDELTEAQRTLALSIAADGTTTLGRLKLAAPVQ